MKRVLLAGVVASVIGIAGCGEQTPEQKARSDAAMKEIKIQRLARGYVSDLLKDPQSAEFKDQNGICGQVNSKNAFGAYTGYQRFIAGSAQLVVLERDSGIAPSEFSQVWNEFCL